MDALVIFNFMPYSPYLPNWVLNLIPMAWKRHLWSTNLALVTFLSLVDLVNFDFMSYCPNMPNLGSLSHFHGLEEAAVVQRPSSDHFESIHHPCH